jgi:hypothetical protein
MLGPPKRPLLDSNFSDAKQSVYVSKKAIRAASGIILTGFCHVGGSKWAQSYWLELYPKNLWLSRLL